MNARTTTAVLVTVLLTAGAAEAQSPYLQPRYSPAPIDGGFSTPPSTGFPNPCSLCRDTVAVPSQPMPTPSYGQPHPPVYMPPPLYGQPAMPPVYTPPVRRW